MEDADTLAEDLPPVAKPPDAPATKRRRQAAEPTVSAELPLARTRRRVGARVSTDTKKRSMSAASLPETAGGRRRRRNWEGLVSSWGSGLGQVQDPRLVAREGPRSD
ncbi:hypothetical protein C4D60_Mb09t06240 [Musa balbisiana]|uniref:Uncharacterized protein n=1 Tax=Musa balbisiana TaxID=52838 RepID=A0A4S8IGT8_MUSBA|nr:hypothetical protein C4D60_Mb09t06240 [Musa balbisiana]